MMKSKFNWNIWTTKDTHVNNKKHKPPSKKNHQNNMATVVPVGNEEANPLRNLSASAKRTLKQNWMGQWEQLCSPTDDSPQLPVWAKNWDMQESAHQLGEDFKTGTS